MEALQGMVKQKSRLLNTLMQLRKAANHPYLFDGTEDRSLPAFGDHIFQNSGKFAVGTYIRLFGKSVRVFTYCRPTSPCCA